MEFPKLYISSNSALMSKPISPMRANGVADDLSWSEPRKRTGVYGF